MTELGLAVKLSLAPRPRSGDAPAVERILSTVGVGAVVFVSTNLDDILLLTAFFSDPGLSRRQIVLGQFAGITVLVLASTACALLALVVPEGWLGLLGLAPLLLGLRRLRDLRRDAETGAAEASPEARPGGASRAGWLAVAGVTVANGGDNLGVYIPLFSNATRMIPLYAAVFAAMTGAWCWLGHALVHHPLLGAKIRKHGRVALPFVLMGLGVWILSKALVLLR